MEAFFNNGILFGEETLNHLHIFAGPWLDAVMVAVTTAGNEIFYIIALPVIYWCVDKKIAINVGAAFLITMTLNDSVKFAFNNPRPDPGKLLPGIRELARHYAPGNPGFPSGHTQGSVAFWTPIAILSKNRTALALCAFMIIMVPYSRIYLGVHFLGDIVGGFVIGAISLAIVMPAIAAVGGRYQNVNEWIMISALLIIPFMVCITLHGNHIYATMGTISGFLSGALIADSRIQFHPKNRARYQLAKIIIGLSIVAIIRFGLKAVLPDNLTAGFFRYWLVGFWCAFGAPFIFGKIAALRGRVD